MRFVSFWQHRAGRHGLGWLLALALLGLLAWQDTDPAHTPDRLAYSLLALSLFALTIYLHFWLLTHWLERQRYGRYGLATGGLLLAGGSLLAAGTQGLHRLLHDDESHLTSIGLGVLNLALGLVLATGARYARRGVVSHLQVQQLRAQQLETELNLLKSQVNQHFLFNTLNNLYGLSLARPAQIPQALLQLAGLMRYQLDSGREQPITVGSEAEYLANYIGLEKLRLREGAQVEWTPQLLDPAHSLAPLLLLPLVENCFKHAVGPGSLPVIRVWLTQTPTTLTLRTENTVPPQFRPAPSGLGLPTLRARLAQYYPADRHKLVLEAGPDYYRAYLTLVL